MEQKQFAYSEETVKQRKRIINTMIILLPIAMIAFGFLFSAKDGMINPILLLTVLGIVSIFLIIEMLVVSRITIKKLSQSALTLTEDKVELKSGAYRDTMLLKDIKSISVRKDKKGKILLIKLSADKKFMNITGFDNLSDVLDHLIQHLPEETPKHEKAYKINWSSQAAVILTFVITFATIVAMMFFSKIIYDYFNIIFQFGFGIFMLAFRPASRYQGSRFRMVEIVCGVIMIVCGVFSLFGTILIQLL